MNTAPKETAELLHFFCVVAKKSGAALVDDGRISLPEAMGLLMLTTGAPTAFAGIEKIPAEMADLTADEARELGEIPAQYFKEMLPHQHRLIAEAFLAILPPFVNFLQVVRNSAALAAEFPGTVPKAEPA